MKSTLSILFFAALAAAASAQNLVLNGTLTASDPTYNRALTLTSLSGSGTAVHYDTYAFKVSVTGTYAAEELSTDATTFDPFLYVYSTFTPSNALSGLLNGDDDYTGNLPIIGVTTGSSSLTASRIVTGDATNLAAGGLALTAGTTYVAVVTAFSNTGLGNYTLGLGGGPGVVTLQAVPEPATFAALGLGAVAMLRRRRKA